ncbi:hypothetical protein GCM10018790_30510 [Kitasatospora xanthocidica]|nr:hypothetical protein GCM10018790_30510 [Kitasatospora xanthocidica]
MLRFPGDRARPARPVLRTVPVPPRRVREWPVRSFTLRRAVGGAVEAIGTVRAARGVRAGRGPGTSPPGGDRYRPPTIGLVVVVPVLPNVLELFSARKAPRHGGDA